MSGSMIGILFLDKIRILGLCKTPARPIATGCGFFWVFVSN